MHRIADSDGRLALAERFRRIASGCLVAFVIVPAIAFVATWLGMRAGQREARDSVDWPTAPGKILESEIGTREGVPPSDQRPTRGKWRSHRARLRYSYTVGGEERIGTRIEVYQRFHATPEEAAAEIADYPAGAAVVVRFDPADPARAVLEPGPTEFDNTMFFAIGGGFLAIAVVLAIVLLALLRSRGENLRGSGT